MAEVIPSTSTFDALTEDYNPRRLVDNIFQGTPLYNYMRRNMEPQGGRSWQPLVEYEDLTGAWYDKGDTMAIAASGQIATRARFIMTYYQLPLYIYAQDTELQQGEALVDLFQAYIKNALNSFKKALSPAFYTGNDAADPKQIQGLSDACDNAQDWGELDYTTYATWNAHVMEGATVAGVQDFGEAVSPTLNNLGKLIRDIELTTGEKPDLILIQPAYWDVLFAQYAASVTVMDQVSRKDPVARWGFEAIYVHGVPIVPDRDCPGEAWVPGQGTRVLAKGYQALALNFNHLKLAYNKTRAFKWDPDGWRRPENVDAYFNRLYFWGALGGDSRRTLGRLYNVDIAQDSGDWFLGTVTIPE